MDPFEPIRRAAADLHGEAVARGADPWQPMTLCEKAAEALDCSIAAVGAGEPVLRGGQAIYDPTIGLIAHEAGDKGMSAFLVGHELGHVLIHRPAETIVAKDADPARLSQSAGGAIDVVGDYSRKARREVQMDLFGREFVLPRARARRLYLEEGLSAASIGERSGLPFALVAQQLLDALLLPPVQTSEAAAPPPRPPDRKQADAAGYRGSAFQLQAGPGTGKTKTLIERVVQLIDDPQVDPTTILVLTFSNKAAGELTERLAIARPDSAGAVWIGTFHAFGLDLVRRYHEQLQLPDDPRLADKADAIGLLEAVIPPLPLDHYRNLWDPTLNLSDILSAISRAKDEVVDAAGYARLIDAMIRRDEEPEEAFRIRVEKLREVAAVYAAYEAGLRDRRWLDYGDLIMTPVRFLEGNPEIAAEVRERHRFVLVDEYQDVNRASIRLVKAVAGNGERLWVVGDSRQSIYRFRGASAANMAAFANDFSSAAVDRLETNYRSSAEIVAAFSAFSREMRVSREPHILPLELDAEQGRAGIVPQHRTVDHPDDEPAAIAHAIEALKRDGTAYADQAVLCRGNARLARTAAALEQRDIPVLYLGSLFERMEVKELLVLLSLLVDPRGAGLAGLGAQVRYRMSLTDVHRLLRHARESTEPLGWLETAAELEISLEAVDSLRTLKADLEGFGLKSSPWSVLVELVLDRAQIARRLASSSSNRHRMQGIALWQFLGFCSSLPPGPGLPIARLLDRIRRMVLLSDERDLRQVPAAAAGMDAVRLLTVHGSKGLEFEAVHVAGVTAASFPASGGGVRCPPPDGLVYGSEGLTGPEAVRLGKDAEEECLFFVALSRAKRHLLLYGETRQASGRTRSPSPFLEPISSQIESVANAPLLRPQRSSVEDSVIEIQRSAATAIDQDEVSSFETCPRRAFYTHVLGVPGARRASPFLKLHDALHDLIGWLRKDPARWSLDRTDILARFDEGWRAKGPVGELYEADYRAAGESLIAVLLDSRRGSTFIKPPTVELQVGGRTIVFTPDEVRIEDGATVLRRVRTGKLGAKELDDDLIYGLYAFAAADHFDPGTRIEAVHLSGGTVTPVKLEGRKLSSRREKAAALAERYTRGEFPPKPDERRCPSCPHFFLCGPVPPGPLELE